MRESKVRGLGREEGTGEGNGEGMVWFVRKRRGEIIRKGRVQWRRVEERVILCLVGRGDGDLSVPEGVEVVREAINERLINIKIVINWALIGWTKVKSGE